MLYFRTLVVLACLLAFNGDNVELGFLFIFIFVYSLGYSVSDKNKPVSNSIFDAQEEYYINVASSRYPPKETKKPKKKVKRKIQTIVVDDEETDY